MKTKFLIIYQNVYIFQKRTIFQYNLFNKINDFLQIKRGSIFKFQIFNYKPKKFQNLKRTNFDYTF